MRAAQIVNFGASERIALRVEEQKQTQFARLVARIERHRRAVHREVHATAAIDDLEINRHAGANFKLITNPESATLNIGTTLCDGAVDLRFEIRTINRREVFRLRHGNTHERRDDDRCKDDSSEFIHWGAPVSAYVA